MQLYYFSGLALESSSTIFVLHFSVLDFESQFNSIQQHYMKQIYVARDVSQGYVQ